MMSNISRGLRAGLLAIAGCALCSASAFADPVFGPQVYVQTAQVPTTYTDQVNNPKSSVEPFVFWFQNGDDGGGQVTNAVVTVNGKTVATEANFSGIREVFSHYVLLNSGENTISVTMSDPTPGDYFTLVVLPLSDRFDIIVGRLLLPDANGNTALEIKNGAHNYGRNYVAHFFNADGSLAASSTRATLAPRASFTGTASSIITSGSWTNGSVEIFYCGRGAARLFGQAATVDNTDTSVQGMVVIQHAGSRRRDPYKAYNQD
jgi:hypothetical protein